MFYDLRDLLAVRVKADKIAFNAIDPLALGYGGVGAIMGGMLGGAGTYLTSLDKEKAVRNAIIGAVLGGGAGYGVGHAMRPVLSAVGSSWNTPENQELYENSATMWGRGLKKGWESDSLAAYTGSSPYLDKKAYTLIELGLATGLAGGALLGGKAIHSHYKRKALEEKRAREVAFNRKAALAAGIAGGAMLGGYALHRAYGNSSGLAKTASAYNGPSPYLDKRAMDLGEMRMYVLGEASAARQAAEAARAQPAPTVADTVKATAEKAYTRKKASPAVNPKFFKRMLSTRGGKAALIGGAGLAALGLGGAGYAGYRKYSKPEVPWYLTQEGTAGIGALAGGLMGAGAGYGAAGRPGAGAGGLLGAIGGAAAGYYGNDMIRGYAGY